MRDAFCEGLRQPILIAEIANNHDGNPARAIELARKAMQAGASVVKFQIGIDKLCSQRSPLHATFKRLSISLDDWAIVRRKLIASKIPWTASVWSDEAAAWLGTKPEVPFIKIGSGDLTHDPILKTIGMTGKPVVLSTGLATRAEIEHAIDVLRVAGCPDVALLACTVSYPTDPSDANVDRMVALRELADVVGYSSHCPSWFVPAIAFKRGADMVEAHFGDVWGHDTDGTLGPVAFAALSSSARGWLSPNWTEDYEKQVAGSASLGVLECERKWLAVARRNKQSGVRE